MSNKIVLAYSGGLDTSVAVPWLKENYDAEVITVTIDLGMVDLDAIKQRAIEVGADKAVTIDAKTPLVNEYIWPALKAGAMYEEEYPLATALGRPLIAKCLVDVAKAEGAYAIAILDIEDEKSFTKAENILKKLENNPWLCNYCCHVGLDKLSYT